MQIFGAGVSAYRHHLGLKTTVAQVHGIYAYGAAGLYNFWRGLHPPRDMSHPSAPPRWRLGTQALTMNALGLEN